VAAGDSNGGGETRDDLCNKVDFMFVIDNSGSMADEQTILNANFPAFISGIESIVAVDDIHIGVHTTDDGLPGDPDEGGGLGAPWNLPECVGHLSGLVGRTGGWHSSNATCAPFAEGTNFMTQADDLPVAFDCAARLGISGVYPEKPMETVVEVVEGPLDFPGGCNEGYLRDDSLLVIVIITDESDGDNYGGSVGTPITWFNDVVAARGGVESNVVVLSLVNYVGGSCPPLSDVWDGEEIVTFTNMFTHGFVGGVCEPDYAPYFEQAIGVIDDACDNFTPPG
jgi:hypothetical protein